MNAFQHLSRIATHLDYGRSHALALTLVAFGLHFAWESAQCSLLYKHGSLQANHLKEENRVLREQLGKRPIKFRDSQRRRLARKGKLVGHPVAHQLGSQYGCESTLRTKTVSVHIKELKVASSSRLRTKTRLPRSNAENVLVDCFAITDRRHD